jgi:hypothetical protein
MLLFLFDRLDHLIDLPVPFIWLFAIPAADVSCAAAHTRAAAL